MEPIKSGTLSTIGGYIYDEEVLGAGTLIVELDLSPMTDVDDINIYPYYKVCSAGSANRIPFDIYLHRTQPSPRWMTPPFVVSGEAVTVPADTYGPAWSSGASYKVFRLNNMTSQASGRAAYTTGQSITLTGEYAGAYVLLFCTTDMGAGGTVKISATVDSEVVLKSYLKGSQYPEIYQSEVVLASETGCVFNIDFEYLASSTYFEWNLLRVV